MSISRQSNISLVIELTYCPEQSTMMTVAVKPMMSKQGARNKVQQERQKTVEKLSFTVFTRCLRRLHVVVY